jgi:hypothetical protein
MPLQKVSILRNKGMRVRHTLVILIVDRSSELKERHLAQAPLFLRAGVINGLDDQELYCFQINVVP